MSGEVDQMIEQSRLGTDIRQGDELIAPNGNEYRVTNVYRGFGNVIYCRLQSTHSLHKMYPARRDLQQWIEDGGVDDEPWTHVPRDETGGL